MSSHMTELPTLYQSFIHRSRYAKWIEEESRRETWEETVDRFMGYMVDVQCKGKISPSERDEIRKGVLTLEVMPSMRCIMTAGEALDRDNVAGFNCSYLAIDDIVAFDELLYVLMCGTGAGFSVERQFVNKLPTIAERLRPSKTTISVHDSKIGWANAYRELIAMLYQGRVPQWDVSDIRPAGERLKTFGGRASGPDPLVDLFKYTIAMFKGAAGRKLSSVECHDLCCKVGEIVVVGGVRRSALISLSNPSDDRMRHAKSGQWWDTEPQRMLANNSACYTEKPDMDTFMREWMALMESKSGERGIFNRESAKKIAKKHGRRDPEHEFGCNPCSEILLRSMQFCNLSEVVVRAEDTIESLKRKIRLAVIIGTMQSTLTKFRYLRPKWSENTEEECLLGVSLTGILDNSLMAGKEGKKALVAVLEELRNYSVEVNAEWAEKLGVNQSVAVTCVKPSGTVSQLVDCSSGIHPRFSPYYVRTVRADKKDPLCQMMTEMGFPVEDEINKPDHTSVFSFPVKSPDCSIISEDFNAIEHLELWRTYQVHWCEHKPSVTIYVRDHEWMEVGAWVYKHWDLVSGISFLPHTGHTYQQAPYQECTEEEYTELMEKMPKDVNWDNLSKYEEYDQTIGSQTLSCTGGSCELVDLSK
jgi:ribonucleoside-diphosphate reductase alpha chain